jgi:tetratricopeptide (TPR) repeat protein
LQAAALVAAAILLGASGIAWLWYDKAGREAERLAELSQRQKDTERAVELALAEAEQWRDKARAMQVMTGKQAESALVVWAQAEAKIGEAAAALSTGVAHDRLKERLQVLTQAVRDETLRIKQQGLQLLKQEKLWADLDDARMTLSTWVDHQFDFQGAALKFRTAYEAYGIDVKPGQSEELASRIQSTSSKIREDLVAGLNAWHLAAAKSDIPAETAALRALLDTVDNDAWRKTFRKSTENWDELLQQASKGPELPLPSVHLLVWSMMSGVVNNRDITAEFLRRERNRHPADFWICYGLAALLDNSPQSTRVEVEETIGCLRTALALRPNASALYNDLGLALRKKNLVEEAVAAYRKAIEINPKNANAHINLANVYASRKQYAEAIAGQRKAIEINPRNATAYHNLGLSLAYTKQYEEAIAAYRKAVEINPRYASAYYNLGHALRRSQQLAEAIGALQKAIEIDPGYTDAHVDLGVFLTDAKQPVEAIAAFRRALEIDPKHHIAFNGLGNALLDVKQRPEAIAAYRQAIKTNPKYATAYYNLALALAADNYADDAITAYRQFLELNPKFAQAHINLGWLLLGRSDVKGAVAAYQKALELEPKNTAVLNSLAWLLATNAQIELRDPAEAVKLATQAVELAPKVGNIWNTLGVAQYRAGDWSASVAALEKSISLGKGGTATDWLFLAMAHWQRGDKEQARKWYRQASQWMEDNNSHDQELLRFRAEATELLGTTAPMATCSKLNSLRIALIPA